MKVSEMDGVTQADLDLWLCEYVHVDDRTQAEADIERALINNPEMLADNQPWQVIRAHGRYIRELIHDAAEASEVFGDDACEEYARRLK